MLDMHMCWLSLFDVTLGPDGLVTDTYPAHSTSVLQISGGTCIADHMSLDVLCISDRSMINPLDHLNNLCLPAEIMESP